ncbi:MAG: DEAD/DEAH box helicase family protein [Ruminococcus sp.]|nr:DEAD/DEAH box helicase family protein [Ruminococcus sp.]
MYFRIVRNGLWEKIKSQEKTVRDVTYITGFGGQFIDDERRVMCYYLDKCFISEVIPERSIERLNGKSSAFIVSQTGTGKTTFIFNTCLPVALSRGKKVLYLCNRTALAAQVKQEAITCESNKNKYVNRLLVEDYNKYYSEEGLSRINNFGCIDIYTYQGLLSAIDNINFDDYELVILDEAHFFISDATFNPYTEIMLDTIIDKCSNCGRLYLSATPQESIDVIWDKEEPHSYMTVYVVQEDYGYINPFFFSNKESIIDIIRKSDKNQLWIIFITNKEEGRKLWNTFGKNQADFFTADSDTNSELYEKITKGKTLDKRILITTKVLDVGVSINDPNVNVVVFEQNIPEIKQMIGRKRVRKNERVNVYFFVPTIKELHKLYSNTLSSMEEAEKSIKEALYSRFISEIKHPVFLHNQEVRVNNFCIQKLNTDLWDIKELIDYLDSQQEKSQELYTTIFANNLLANFPNCRIHNMSLIDKDPEEDMIKIIRKYLLLNNFDEDGLNNLSKEIEKCVGDIRVKKRETTMSKQSLNKILKKYGYVIITRYKPTQHMISPLEEKQDVRLSL